MHCSMHAEECPHCNTARQAMYSQTQCSKQNYFNDKPSIQILIVVVQ